MYTLFDRDMLRSHSLSLPLSPLPRISPKLLCISLHLSTSSSKIINQSFSYGPSLHKGRKPSPPPHHQQNDDVIDRGSFTRVFELLALRVPSELCFPLESRLRGHLLNWPRVRNIARVPNDDIDPELSQFFNSNSQKVVEEEEFDESESSVSFNRRIYGKAEGDGELLSPVLYRDRLARTFDSKGFVKFRSLAKLSRPPRRREGGERRENVSGNGRKNSFAEVEVIGENRDSEEDLRGLLGEGFSGVGKWKGSTRLLLLDERLAGKGVEELPEAIKVFVLLVYTIRILT